MAVASDQHRAAKPQVGQDGMVEMAWDPITRIVGQPRHLHEDQLEGQDRPGVQVDLVDLPRATACSCRARTLATPTSSPAASAGSAATTTPPAPATRRTWRTASSRRTSASGSSTSARPPSTCSTTTSSRRTWSASTTARRWSPRPTRACSSGPTAPRPRAPASTATRPSATSCGRSTRSAATSTARPSRSAGTPARCSASWRAATSIRRRCIPGGSGATATVQLFTDYLSRLARYAEFMKKAVPIHDDIFDFFYEAIPGYEEVGNRRILLNCWGAFQDPDVCNFAYRDMSRWGDAMFVTPGIVRDGELVTHDLVDINLGINIHARLLVLRRLGGQGAVRHQGPARQPGRPSPPVEPAHRAGAAEARLRRQVQLGHVTALVRRQRVPGHGHRRRRARPALEHGAGRPRRHRRLREVHRPQRARSTSRRPR